MFFMRNVFIFSLISSVFFSSFLLGTETEERYKRMSIGELQRLSRTIEGFDRSYFIRCLKNMSYIDIAQDMLIDDFESKKLNGKISSFSELSRRPFVENSIILNNMVLKIDKEIEGMENSGERINAWNLQILAELFSGTHECEEYRNGCLKYDINRAVGYFLKALDNSKSLEKVQKGESKELDCNTERLIRKVSRYLIKEHVVLHFVRCLDKDFVKMTYDKLIQLSDLMGKEFTDRKKELEKAKNDIFSNSQAIEEKNLKEEQARKLEKIRKQKEKERLERREKIRGELKKIRARKEDLRREDAELSSKENRLKDLLNKI